MSRKKSSHIDLHAPQRQSYVAILIIVYKLINSTVKQSLPAIIVIIVGGSMKKMGAIAIFVIVLAIVLSIYSIIAFYKYYFYIKDDNLIVHKGVFKKTVLEIPFDRIQSINNEQNLIHRIFSVIKLNVDTAGSSKEEVQLYAIKEEVGQQLREYILENKKVIVENVETGELQEELPAAEVKEKIFRLNLVQLLKVGFTANHLRSFGIIVFFFFTIYDNIKEVGMDLMEEVEDYLPMAEALLQSIFFMFFISVLFVIVSFLVSVITTILRFYGLTMYRMGDGFIIESGLFNRKQYAAKDSKIQILSWSQNLLQRIAKIHTIVMQQASSVNAVNIKNATAAGLVYENVTNVSRYIFEEKYTDLETLQWKRINSYYVYKLCVRWTWIFIVPLCLMIYNQKLDIFIPVFILYLILIWSSFLRYKKKKYGVSENIVAIRGGAFGHQLSIMEVHKVQNIRMTQTPFQRRRGLSSLLIHTAATTIEIPEIDTEEALVVKDYLLYKVESSHAAWM
ncbi:PH domain-containing protein [Saprospiraceae bacterium]|nr:PH domain-containing protein [Saprospiraceae bacterium]